MSKYITPLFLIYLILCCSSKLFSPFIQISIMICSVTPNMFTLHCLLPSVLCHPLHSKAVQTYCLHFVDATLHFPFALQTTPTIYLASSQTLMKLLLPRSQRPHIAKFTGTFTPASFVREGGGGLGRGRVEEGERGREEGERQFGPGGHSIVLKLFSFLSFLYNIYFLT